MNKITFALGKTSISQHFLKSDFAKNYCDHQAIAPIHQAFRPMTENIAFDASEMAIVTAMQAVDHGRDIVPLPITVASRVQHKCIIQNANFTAFSPKELEGKKVAVRAYSQTTGAWVRAVLETEFDVDCTTITWITQNPPHVADAPEPANVWRDPNGKSTLEQLSNGLVDAAIFGNDLPTDSWVKPVIDNADAVGRASLEKSGLIQINHVIAVSRRLFDQSPSTIKALFDAFRDARALLPIDDQKMLPIGKAEMEQSINILAQSAFNQGLTTKTLSFDDIFGDATAVTNQR
jgi:4,5-dihydroxyphthalate decarboxylase